MQTVLAWAAVLLATVPVTADSQDPAIPSALSPYLTDGTVAPADYRWMRGRFPGASAAEVQAYIAAIEYDNACVDRSRSAMVAKMKALEQAFNAGQGVYARSTACRAFSQPFIAEGVSWADFAAALGRVRPYALGVLRTTDLAEQQVIDHGSYAEQLRTRTLGEQVLRNAWIESQRHQGETAGYSPLERALHEAILLRALEDRDQANTQWLAGWVAGQGWPSRYVVGEDASRAAWLLVQHADADPAFQLTALRLMAPLADKGSVETQDFAMLTDRVRLKLTGKQRYGTQWTCDKGRRAPLPLERDEAATDGLRTGVGLEPLAINAKQIDRMYGPCPTAG